MGEDIWFSGLTAPVCCTPLRANLLLFAQTQPTPILLPPRYWLNLLPLSTCVQPAHTQHRTSVHPVVDVLGGHEGLGSVLGPQGTVRTEAGSRKTRPCRERCCSRKLGVNNGLLGSPSGRAGWTRSGNDFKTPSPAEQGTAPKATGLKHAWYHREHVIALLIQESLGQEGDSQTSLSRRQSWLLAKAPPGPPGATSPCPNFSSCKGC